MAQFYCMKYFHSYNCDDHSFNGVDCSKCVYSLRELVDFDAVMTIVQESHDREEMLHRLSVLNKVSTEYLSTNGAEKLDGVEV